MRVSALGLGPGIGLGFGFGLVVLGLAASACASRLSPLDRLLRTRFPSTTAPPSLSSDYDASYEDDQDLDDLATAPPLLNDDARHVWESRTHYSPHSQYKWNHLGSRTSINAYRNSKLGHTSQRHHTDNEVQQAVANALRVSREHECRWPKQRLVRVKDVYPHPNKRYIPHCALLHQCGDDTGCCHGDTLSCVAGKSQPVYLYFYTTTMNSGATVEKLKFFNHTECSCEDRMDMAMPRDMSFERRFQEKQTHSSCRCPTHFHVRRLHASTTCTCECFDEQHSCLRLRKGKDYFSHADRVCIQSGNCEVPACEFGSYLRKAGRCPRKKEKILPWNVPSFKRY